MKYILAILLTIIIIPGYSCINEYHTRLNGELIESDGYPFPNAKNNNRAILLKDLSALEKAYKKNNSVQTLSDYGAVLIYLGRYKEAIQLYQKLENQKPDVYTTAANLGTAFELTGQNDSAYFYIKKAIAINPDSHEGSEWIHLRILEVKQQLQKDPNYLQNKSVLNLDSGTDKIPVIKTNTPLRDLEDQISFQLSERITFVKPKDIIVGQLYFNLGNIMAITKDVQTALIAYNLAKEYGYNSALMEKRISAFTFLAYKADLANALADNLLITLLVICAVLFGIFWFIKRLIKTRRRKTITC